MAYKITVIEGDGIGPEITAQAVLVLSEAAKRSGFELEFNKALLGGVAIDETGGPLPEETVASCKDSDAVLLGAVGGDRWDSLPGDKRPEAGLLGIRSALGLFANLRPAVVYPELRGASPLKDEILGDGLDLLVIRELTGGIYFGKRGRRVIDGDTAAFDTEEYTKAEITRIARVAFELSLKRSKRLCSVDKANVLESSRFWRETVAKLSAGYPDVLLSHMYVDNAAMQLVRNPRQFDVILTNNMFGDILSDEASQITGSIGMLPSASLGASSLGLYEPVHGSAPDIAGKDMANPVAAILSAAMLLRYSLGEEDAAKRIESAVGKAIQNGARTADIKSAGGEAIGTREMGERILKELDSF